VEQGKNPTSVQKVKCLRISVLYVFVSGLVCVCVCVCIALMHMCTNSEKRKKGTVEAKKLKRDEELRNCGISRVDDAVIAFRTLTNEQSEGGWKGASKASP